MTEYLLSRAIRGKERPGMEPEGDSPTIRIPIRS